MSFSNQDLRKAGLKVTLPRIKILELLENSTIHHLSAEDVYKALLEQGEDVGLATVYRVLTQFESAGIVERHHFEGGHSVFEISQGEHHDHIVCIMCNKVLEFNDDVIEAQQHKVAQSLGFTLTDHALHLYGVCSAAECQERAGGRKNFK
jgi:Fur family ferric uptake transcriptional regulator